MFACAATETYAWGWNESGQLGIGSTDSQVFQIISFIFETSLVQL
jgi:alpha-tubulin suppressor-like RCC1 family protein